jgi:hypothetical protein
LRIDSATDGHVGDNLRGGLAGCARVSVAQSCCGGFIRRADAQITDTREASRTAAILPGKELLDLRGGHRARVVEELVANDVARTKRRPAKRLRRCRRDNAAKSGRDEDNNQHAAERALYGDTRIDDGCDEPELPGEVNAITAVHIPASSCEPGMVNVPHSVVLASAVADFVLLSTTPASVNVNVHVPLLVITFWTKPETSTASALLSHAA